MVRPALLESLNPVHQDLRVVTDSIVAGRHPRACQVVFKDLRFSQLHTKIFRNTSEPDAVMVEDLSSNGTFVNGVKIGKGNKRRAVNGDIVSLIVVPRLVEGAWKCPDRNMVSIFAAYKVVIPAPPVEAEAGTTTPPVDDDTSVTDAGVQAAAESTSAAIAGGKGQRIPSRGSQEREQRDRSDPSRTDLSAHSGRSEVKDSQPAAAAASSAPAPASALDEVAALNQESAELEAVAVKAACLAVQAHATSCALVSMDPRSGASFAVAETGFVASCIALELASRADSVRQQAAQAAAAQQMPASSEQKRPAGATAGEGSIVVEDSQEPSTSSLGNQDEDKEVAEVGDADGEEEEEEEEDGGVEEGMEEVGAVDSLGDWLKENKTDSCRLEQHFDKVTDGMLGQGGFGKVYKGKHKATGTEVAIKEINKLKVAHMGNMRSQQFRDEFQLHAMVSHPNIVRLYAMYETSSMIYLVMERVYGGDLFDFLSEYADKTASSGGVGGIGEGSCRRMIRPALEGVAYLHSLKICHRDLKPENIMMSSSDMETTTLKITDFGLSKIVGGSTRAVTKLGTYSYMAPEVAMLDNERDESSGGYGTAADVWGMGAVLFVMLSCTLLFDEPDDVIETRLRGMMENEHAGVESKRDFFHNKEAWECVSDDAKDLVAWMLTTDPDQRPTCEEALDHVWFKHGEAKKRGIDGAWEAGAASKKARGQGSRAFSV